MTMTLAQIKEQASREELVEHIGLLTMVYHEDQLQIANLRRLAGPALSITEPTEDAGLEDIRQAEFNRQIWELHTVLHGAVATHKDKELAKGGHAPIYKMLNKVRLLRAQKFALNHHLNDALDYLAEMRVFMHNAAQSDKVKVLHPEARAELAREQLAVIDAFVTQCRKDMAEAS